MSATATITIKILSELIKALDLSSPEDVLDELTRIVFANGAGANSIQKIWHDQNALASGASQDYDLTALGDDALGDAVSLSAFKLLFIRNNSTTAGENLQIGGAVTNGVASCFVAANDGVIVGPGGIHLWVNPSAAGYAVADGSADILRIKNAGTGSITYDIIIMGIS